MPTITLSLKHHEYAAVMAESVKKCVSFPVAFREHYGMEPPDRPGRPVDKSPAVIAARAAKEARKAEKEFQAKTRTEPLWFMHRQGRITTSDKVSFLRAVFDYARCARGRFVPERLLAGRNVHQFLTDLTREVAHKKFAPPADSLLLTLPKQMAFEKHCRELLEANPNLPTEELPLFSQWEEPKKSKKGAK